MSDIQQGVRPSNAVRRARAAERDAALRQRLIRAGTTLFARHGVGAVSVADLLGESQVSRATFYGLFANKNELAVAILRPVFEAGIDAAAPLQSRAPRDAAEGVVDVYLGLWRQHRDALVLSGRIDEAVFAGIRAEHDAFNSSLLEALKVVEAGGLLRNGSAEDTLRVLAGTAIPLLRVYTDRADPQDIVKESMLGLMLAERR